MGKSENNDEPALHPEIWDEKHETAITVRNLRGCAKAKIYRPNPCAEGVKAPIYRTLRMLVLDWHSLRKDTYFSALTPCAQGFGQLILDFAQPLIFSTSMAVSCFLSQISGCKAGSQLFSGLLKNLCTALGYLLKVCKALAQPFWN